MDLVTKVHSLTNDTPKEGGESAPSHSWKLLLGRIFLNNEDHWRGLGPDLSGVDQDSITLSGFFPLSPICKLAPDKAVLSQERKCKLCDKRVDWIPY